MANIKRGAVLLFLLAMQAGVPASAGGQTAAATLTGHWSGKGKKAAVELDVIGCNDARCLFRLSLSNWHLGLGGDQTGVIHLKPVPRVQFDKLGYRWEKKRYYEANLSIEGERIAFELSDCIQTYAYDPPCREEKVFQALPERFYLKKTSDVPSFSPSFDCSNARRPFEENICTREWWAEVDRSLHAEYKEYIDHLKEPAEKEALKEQQRGWYKKWVEGCAKDSTGACYASQSDRVMALRRQKQDAVLCRNEDLAEEIKEWNRHLIELREKNKRREPVPYALSNLHWHLLELHCNACDKTLPEKDFEGCMRRELERNRARLERARISPLDWRWMLVLGGFDDLSPARDGSINTHEFLDDHSTVKFISERLPKGEFDRVRGYFGVPGDILVKDDRYVWIEGCVHQACFMKGFLWIDVHDKKITLGTCSDEEDLTHQRQHLENPEGKEPLRNTCELKGPFAAQ